MLCVTGANGFIGAGLIWEIGRRTNQEIIAVDAVDRDARPQLLANRKIHKFLSSDNLFDFLQTKDAEKITGVFHMGACSSTTETDVEYLRRNNTEYSAKLFAFCAERQIPYIGASSGAVYGDGAGGFDDSTPTEHFKPLNPYGRSKAAFDIWASEQKHQPPKWASLRFFNVYGPGESHKGEMSSVVFKAFRQIRGSGSLKLFRSHKTEYKDGEQLRDFVYIKDITQWMWEIFNQRSFANGIYNMGFGQARTWLDLAQSVFTSMGVPMKIEWIDIPESIRHQYQYFTEAKMERLFQQNISRPRWNLESGVADYVGQYLLKDNPYL